MNRRRGSTLRWLPRLKQWQRIKMKPQRFPYPALARHWQAHPPTWIDTTITPQRKDKL